MILPEKLKRINVWETLITVLTFITMLSISGVQMERK